MKKKRKLLVSSMIMILFCCLLFAGTTFAWFSDRVTSSNNIITAGNLDVELEYSTNGGESWSEVTEAPIFTSKTWEPGHAEAVLLKVVNAGSLALKYSISLTTTEVESINVYGEEFKLSDYLEVGSKILDLDEEKPVTTRKEAVKFAEENNLGFDNVLNGKLVSGTNELVQIAVVMPESLENEVNHAKDAPAPSISFSINLFATQLNYEKDSFDENYDKGAAWFGEIDTNWYNAEQSEFTLVSGSELAGLAQLVNEGNTFAGKTVKLGANINLSNTAWTPIGLTGDQNGFAGTFDGQGYIISNLLIDLTAEPKYQSAGLFGSARNAVIKNFTVKDANVKNLTTPNPKGATSCGTAVVLGSSQFESTVENVKVIDAEVSGNRYVSAIAGYFKGSINGCSVNKAKLLATPDNFTGEYDNGDKVGAIIGYSNGAVTLTNNAVSDVEIKGYRDLGGIAGAADCGNVSGNTVSNLTITVDQIKGYYGDNAKNAQAVVGRVLGGIVGENTTSEVSVEALYLLDGFQVSRDDTGVVSLYVIPAEFDETVVTLPKGIEEIGSYAFAYNSNIEKIVLPSTVKTLNDRAFRDTSAKEVVLNEGLENISYQAFRNALNVEKVVIPSTVKTISKEAFQNSGVKSLVIPATVQTIEDGALRDMKSVETVVFEGDVTLPVYALRACTNLKTVIFKGEVTIDGRGMVITNKENGDGSAVTVYVPTEASKQALLAGDTAATDYTGYEIVVGGYAVPGTTEELYDAINNKSESIILSQNVTVNSQDSANPSQSAYGEVGVQVQEGGLLDGNGNTLTVTGANGTWDCGIYASSGTIQNITVNGSFRGIFNRGLTGDLTLNNVVIDKVCYTFHIDGTYADKHTVTFNNCTLNGWTSYSNVAKVFNFNNCNFGQGTGGYNYAFCRPYNDSVFTGCVFSVGYEFDASKTGEITFVNCYVGNTLITQENVAQLLGSSASSIIVSNK